MGNVKFDHCPNYTLLVSGLLNANLRKYLVVETQGEPGLA